MKRTQIPALVAIGMVTAMTGCMLVRPLDGGKSTVDCGAGNNTGGAGNNAGDAGNAGGDGNGAAANNGGTGGAPVTSPPAPPVLTLAYAIKQLQFSWPAVATTDHYQLYQIAASGSDFTACCSTTVV